jgi:DNA-binding MarR family transcriptional regulator
MELQDFFPYRMAVLSEAVSQCVAQVYRERFGLTRDEWRVLAALAGTGWMKTARVIETTTLEKMPVSRAVARLERDGLIERRPDPDDGRGHLLRIAPPGRALHAKVVPMVRAREAFLLEALDENERRLLDGAIDKLRDRALQLVRHG